MSFNASVHDVAAADVGQFASRLAQVIFEDPAQALPANEMEVIRRFETLVDATSASRLNDLARRIDSVLVSSLSSGGVLRVARCIEAKAPGAIDLMPKLSMYRGHLLRSHEVADAFSFSSLERLAAAIREEAKRGGE